MLRSKRLSPKLRNYRKAQDAGYGFIANVILNGHSQPAKKLAGLVKLIDRGATVRVADFNIDCLIVNGEAVTWGYLERA